jgi:hypothetical protein
LASFGGESGRDEKRRGNVVLSSGEGAIAEIFCKSLNAGLLNQRRFEYSC